MQFEGLQLMAVDNRDLNFMLHTLTRLSNTKIIHGQEYIVDDESRSISFIMYNLSGQMTGVLTYLHDKEKTRSNAEDGRYHLQRSERLDYPVFGLTTIDWSKPLYVVEGAWDSASIKGTGRNCIALLGKDGDHVYEWLKTLPVPTIAISDGDAVGLDLLAWTDYGFVLPKGEDPNSMQADVLESYLLAFEHTVRYTIESM